MMRRMKAIDKKIFRNLWEMKGQALAIALVIASGIATFVMSLSTLDSLQTTRASFYSDYRFGDGFASLKRAPNRIASQVEAIDGIDTVETRVAAFVNLEIVGYERPVTAKLLSVPEGAPAQLNKLYLRIGSLPDPAREDQVAVSEAFADAHRFVPGDTLFAMINGRRKELTIVGIVLSPEFVYQIAPGSMIPDFAAYGILWMGEAALSKAYDLSGAFNDLSFTLVPRAASADIIDRVDTILEPYGGQGAYLREDQLSHRFLSEEFRQLRQMSIMFPMMFLGVAAFLLNVVISRLIQMQREQIAALKAFGYSNLAVGLHYLKLVLVIVLLGVIGGTLLGMEFGQAMSNMYMRFYKFPYLDYVLRPIVVLGAILISSVAAVLGNVYAVRQAASLPPAEAMRPAPPANYRVSIVERLGLRRFLTQPTRMVIRHIERTPVKSGLTVLGIAFGCAILILGLFFNDAMAVLVDVQFFQTQREDVSVTLVEPTSYRAAHELRSLPGVGRVEVYRTVPSRLRFQQREYRVAIQGIEAGGDLLRLLDDDLNPVPIPEDGIVLTDHLAKILGCRPGDSVTVEVLDGHRPVLTVPVARVIKQFVGVTATMDLNALSRLLGQGSAVTGAYLSVDANAEAETLSALQARPRVAGTAALRSQMQNFLSTVGNQMLTFAFFNTLLAVSIAFGVVYNSARISLSEQSRELASLRVLGLTRGEISYILLAELGILTLIAIPVGWLIGLGLCAFVATGMQTDLFRIPFVVSSFTFTFAAVVILVSAVVSGVVVRRKLDDLDLIEALKTPE